MTAMISNSYQESRSVPHSSPIENLRSESICGNALTDEHLDAWQHILACDTGFDSPFYTPEFVQAVAEVRPDVNVAILREDGRIRAILPYQFASSWHRRFGAAERIGGEMSDYFGLIADTGINLRATDLLRLCKLHTLDFTHLDETQTRFGLTGMQPETGLRIRLDGGAAAYWSFLARTDKRLVNDTERRERKLINAHGPLRFEIAAGDNAREMERLIAVKRLQYARTGARDALARNWSNDLLIKLSTAHSARCSGMLSVLFAGDTWVASHFGLRNQHLLHYWFPVYNPELKAFSPGRLLLKAVIAAADGASIDLIDRGAGDHASKREFANNSHSYLRDTWYVPGPRSLCYRVARSLAWKLSSQ